MQQYVSVMYSDIELVLSMTQLVVFTRDSPKYEYSHPHVVSN